jgi:peroxiredoxin/uncharacterized membrane protein YphA (DoxX/SURF4 family)
VIELARLLLAAVFAVAGIAKLADRDGTRRAVRDFGVPSALAPALAFLLPVAELAVAAGLVPGASARFAAAGAAALLALFTIAIANALLRGRTPDCHCFGQLHSAPAGSGTLARNAALAGLAVLIAAQPASDPSSLQLAGTAVALVVAAQALLLWKLLCRYGHALRRIEELEAGAGQQRTLEAGIEAPLFALPSVGGGKIALPGLLARARPVLLVFADPGCGPCQALMPRLAEWQQLHAKQLTLAVISRGDVEENAEMEEEHGLRDVLVQGDREVAELYGVEATPSATLIGADGRVKQAVAPGGSAIEQLVRSITPDAEPTREPAANGRARIATGAAVAGGLAGMAAAAHASPDAQSQQPPSEGVQAINAAVRAAGKRLAAASRRSHKAVQAQATLGTGKAVRARRAAAQRALAAERREVLALRTTLSKLAPTDEAARKVRYAALAGLSLLAQSLQKRQRALVAAPKDALRLLGDSQRLFLNALGLLAQAARLSGRA